MVIYSGIISTRTFDLNNTFQLKKKTLPKQFQKQVIVRIKLFRIKINSTHCSKRPFFFILILSKQTKFIFIYNFPNLLLLWQEFKTKALQITKTIIKMQPSHIFLKIKTMKFHCGDKEDINCLESLVYFCL